MKKGKIDELLSSSTKEKNFENIYFFLKQAVL